MSRRKTDSTTQKEGREKQHNPQGVRGQQHHSNGRWRAALFRFFNFFFDVLLFLFYFFLLLFHFLLVFLFFFFDFLFFFCELCPFSFLHVITFLIFVFFYLVDLFFKLFFDFLYFLVCCDFGVARLTLQTRKLWLL